MSCKKNMSFEECELAILRGAVDKIDKKIGTSKLNNPEIKKIDTRKFPGMFQVSTDAK